MNNGIMLQLLLMRNLFIYIQIVFCKILEFQQHLFLESSKSQQNDNIFLGSFPISWYYGFDGIIDEVRIYNKILSEDEIKKLNHYPVNNLDTDIKEIDISNCNLQKGQYYTIVGFTDKTKVEQVIIAK